MADKIFDNQVNETWSLTFNPSDRIPLINNRIFKTKAEAQAYIDDTKPGASAIPGITLSVINDGGNNGVYLVSSIKTGNVPGTLTRLSSGSNHVVLSEDEYNQLKESGELLPDVFYNIYDE